MVVVVVVVVAGGWVGRWGCIKGLLGGGGSRSGLHTDKSES